MAKYNFPSGETAESIATALSLVSNIPIRKDQVVVEPTPQAGQYLITVYESADFATKVIPFLDKHGSIPTSMGELCTVGYRTNRQPTQMDLRQHGQIIGATESGKTSLIHTMLAHATRCPDCVIWIGGTWKLYDFVGPWLEVYLDKGIKPPLDWVRYGHQDVCEMMAAFLRGAEYRTNLRIHQRNHLPYVILILDEVTYLVSNRLVRANVNGEEMTASAMLAGIARGTAGAGMYEWLATQRDTQDNLGDEGGTTAAQMGFAFVFRIRDPGTVGRVTGDYSLPNPSARGECWADLGPNVPVQKLRVPYPQTPDMNKPTLHDGPRIDEISWTRRHITHELDPGTAAAAGEAYADRFQYVTEEYLDYLRTTKPITASTSTTVGPMDGLLSPTTDAELIEAELYYNKMVAQVGAALGAPQSHAATTNSNGRGDDTTDPGVGSEDELGALRTRTERVLAIVRASGAAMTRAEIIAKLAEMGDYVSDPQVVTNICGKYCKADPPKMGRTDDNKYYVA